uniref:SET domain-containing protein n=1 Tax=Alexandrium monilatum TaxID=311494 RepID=A0A7S4PUY1_9DINO
MQAPLAPGPGCGRRSCGSPAGSWGRAHWSAGRPALAPAVGRGAAAWPAAVAVTATGGALALGRPRRRGNAPPAGRLGSAVSRGAAVAPGDMAKVISVTVPGLAEVARVGESGGGDGLGLFSVRDFEEGEVIHRWPMGGETVMEPASALAEKLESEDFGALAFQILRSSRSTDPSPWRLWWATGVSAPENHPLKLLLSDPELAQRLWASTTCGGRMSASALRLRDDFNMLKGGATLEEWTEAMALVMSRCVVEDEDGVPLLVLGLDLLQDGEDPNVEARVAYETVGGGPLGIGGEGERRASEVVLSARRAVKAGDELIGQYFKQPHGGRYMERYGFVPPRLRGDLAAACVELSFAPTDEDDYHFGVKESLLEDVGLTADPILFLFSTEDSIGPPMDSDDDWPTKSVIDKMVHILRLRHTGGAESYLVDSVYIDDLWYNCNFRISKGNESAVCKAVIDECDRWLGRFQQSEELRDTMVDESRRYWADRKLESLFPQRRAKRGGTGVAFIDDP